MSEEGGWGGGLEGGGAKEGGRGGSYNLTLKCKSTFKRPLN